MKRNVLTFLAILLMSFSAGFAQSPEASKECEVKPPYDREYWCSLVAPENPETRISDSPFPFLEQDFSRQMSPSDNKFYMKFPEDVLGKGEKFKATFRFKDAKNNG